jgi:hypothetical protein
LGATSYKFAIRVARTLTSGIGGPFRHHLDYNERNQ